MPGFSFLKDSKPKSGLFLKDNKITYLAKLELMCSFHVTTPLSMNKIYKPITILLLSIAGINQTSFAQEEILKGSLKDANYLLEGYITPIMYGIGNGLNQGWYNTGKVHKTLGFDLTISATLVYVPTGDQFYQVDNNRLEEVKLVSYDGQQVSATATTNVPTIFGPDKEPSYQVGSNDPFKGPPGLDLKNRIKIANALPVPMYQLGIGLPKGFELKARYAPTLTTGDSKFSLFGLGVMHDVKQYIPGVKALPFDLSAFVGYTNMKAEQKLDVTGGQNQRAEVSFSSTTIQALISKKISVLTVYGSVGYNIAKSNLGMKGMYDLDDNGTPEATDPINLDFSTSSARATGGIRLKFAVFTLHADYTLANYKTLNAGFGINVR
jgi:hypothetical protein